MNESSDTRRSSRGLGLLLVVTATACWSTSGFLIHVVVGNTGTTPVQLAFWRDLAVFLCLLIFLMLYRPELLRIKRSDLPWLAGMGLFGVGLFHTTWNTSVLHNGAALSTVIQSNGPIIVAVAAWALWREPLTLRKLAAISLTVIGSVLIARPMGWQTDTITWIGILAGIGVPIFYSSFSIFGKQLVGGLSPWTIITYAFGFGTLALLPLQIGRQPPWPVPLPAVAAFAGMVLVTTIVGYGLYTFGLKRLQASVASIVATTEVLFAAILAYFLLGERWNGFEVVGAMLVISGVVLLSWPRRNARSG